MDLESQRSSETTMRERREGRGDLRRRKGPWRGGAAGTEATFRENTGRSF